MSILLLTVFLALPRGEPAKPSAYPNAEMLIEPAELAKQISGEERTGVIQSILVDCRPEADYVREHIPHANQIDLALTSAS